jgi:hypothetical protein
MDLLEKKELLRWTAIVVLSSVIGAACAASLLAAPQTQQATPQTAAARPVGTIKAISGKNITLTTDAGTDVNILVEDGARLVRIAPGETDLKKAAPIQLQDLQAGDRILVRGKLADDGKAVLANSVIAMKKTDIAEKQAHEREEWQRHGVGGLVSGVDAANGAITISTNALGAAKNVTVHLSKQTVLRRYAPDSVKFDDAKPAPLEQIHDGDQLRARGTRSADGTELAADEIVSGTFMNIAGTVSSVEASAGTITVLDLITKKPITVKITPESQLRKLSAPMAQRIAMRLKGITPDAPAPPAGSAQATTAPRAADAPAGAANGASRPGGGQTDLQQAISRMPAATIAELQKGDAVMIVATEGTEEKGVTAITLLAGVEAILEASPKSSASTILSPWSLSGAPGGDAATP